MLIWSCGNESYCGDDIAAMSDYFRNVDSTRLVHYEGVTRVPDGIYDHITDMESRMYAKPQEVEEYLRLGKKRPYISCEYMHAMGNSLGGLHFYTDLEDKYEAYCMLCKYYGREVVKIETENDFKCGKELEGIVPDNLFPALCYKYTGSRSGIYDSF